MVHPLLKTPSLNPTVLENYQLVFNLPFLDKVLKQVVATQFQRFLHEDAVGLIKDMVHTSARVTDWDYFRVAFSRYLSP